MFSVVDTVLIKALPFPDADRLVTVMEANPSKTARLSLIAPGRLAEDWNAANGTFAAISGSVFRKLRRTRAAPNPSAWKAGASHPRFFEVFGMTPLVGRLFTPDEERGGGPKAAIVSEAFWQRRFNRAADVVGRRLVCGGAAYTIVGVMPSTFTSASTDVWLPAQTPAGLLRVREARFLSGIGRLKTGVTHWHRPRPTCARVQQALGERYPASDKGGRHRSPT